MGEQQQPLTPRPHSQRTVPGGLYITFEGPEGSGKSTQVALLHDYLVQNGYSVIRTKQPGGTDAGAAIRRILLHPDYTGKILPKTESLLFWADRYQHHEEIVKPALSAGTIIIGDRDFDSSWAIQCYARGLSHDWMDMIHKAVIDDFRPHKTMLLMVPTKVMLARVHARNATTTVGAEESRIDAEKASFHEKVREGFLELSYKEPERFVTVDGTKTIQEIHEQITRAVEALIRERLG